MDLFSNLADGNTGGLDVERVIRTITMHTTGEPTRIVVAGYPDLVGDTLLAKRRCAKENYDFIRRRICAEPRGHRDMYGVILVPDTELTRSGDAELGVLFFHNEGYSTMCGHATFALARFLIDTNDAHLFPNRQRLKYDPESRSVKIRLHAPCGLVLITAPVFREESNGKLRSDTLRLASFLSVPSFAVATNQVLSISPEYTWPELMLVKNDGAAVDPPQVKVDVAFGGAFYVYVSVGQLGFAPYSSRDGTAASGQTEVTLAKLSHATERLKSYIQNTPELLSNLTRHPTELDLQFLYGVIVTSDTKRHPPKYDTRTHLLQEQVKGSETQLCFFADQQLDRSPCGSGVSGRIALGVAKDEFGLGDTWAFQSAVSSLSKEGDANPGEKGDRGSFLGTAVEKVKLDFGGEKGFEKKNEGVVVRVEGRAWYTSSETFVFERDDPLKDGFLL